MSKKIELSEIHVNILYYQFIKIYYNIHNKMQENKFNSQNRHSRISTTHPYSQIQNVTLSVTPSINFQFNNRQKYQKGTSIDRFIPSRKQSTMKQTINEPKKQNQINENNVILRSYRTSILGIDQKMNSFCYRQKKLKSQSFYHSNQLIGLRQNQDILNFKRKIDKVACKILDAPNLIDDFYLNLLDWSHQNILTVGLNTNAYLWASETAKVTKLCDLNQQISSISCSTKNPAVAIGTNSGKLSIYDIVKLKEIQCFQDHEENHRIGTISWSPKYLASGSKDKSIIIYDVRTNQKIMKKSNCHKEQICGLKWSPDEQQLASGGNDNKLCIWDFRIQNPIYKFNHHKAAIKALSWSPHQHGLLSSGGGTKDKCIKLWNTIQGKLLKSVDTGSQICNILFSKNTNQIVSTHGYSQHQIKLWKASQLEHIQTLTGHTSRVLYIALSPDGRTIATGAGDQTIRFWKIFPEQKKSYTQEKGILQDGDFLLH